MIPQKSDNRKKAQYEFVSRKNHFSHLYIKTNINDYIKKHNTNK